MYYYIIISFIVLIVFLLPRFRDYFISGRMILQFVWLVIIITFSFVFINEGMHALDIQFDSKLHFPFHFINSNMASDSTLIGSEWNSKVIIGFIAAIIGSILTGGLLISVFTNMLERRIERIQAGLVSYRFSKHTLFIGYDDIAIGIIREFEKERKTNIKNLISLQDWVRPLLKKDSYLIQTTQDIDTVKQNLMSQLSPSLMKNIYILYKPLDSVEEFDNLYINKTKQLFILNEEDNDANKIRIIKLLAEYRKKKVGKEPIVEGMEYEEKAEVKKRFFLKNPPINCHLSLDYQSTYSIFQNNELLDDIKTYVNIQSFNFNKLWAQKVFVSNNYESKGCDYLYPDLDFAIIRQDDDKQVHLVIVGMTRMGIAMAMKAIRIAHYANYTKRKTRITFIDTDVERQKYIFSSRYASFIDAVDIYNGYDEKVIKGSMTSYTDIEIQFIEDNIENPSCRQYLSSLAQDESKLLTIAICFVSATKSLAVGLYLPKDIYMSDSKVLINQDTAESVFQLIKNEKDTVKSGNIYQNTYAFGMKNDCYDISLNRNHIPMLVNYVYNNSFTYDLEFSLNPSINELQKMWADIRIIYKWSNQYNSEHLSTKVRIIKEEKAHERPIDITREEVMSKLDILARVEHNRWLIEKLLAGFSVANEGEIKELKLLKNTNFKTKTEIRDLMQTNADSSLIEEKKRKSKLEWETIKAIKNDIEGKGVHDCLVPFDELNELDKYTDIAIVEAIPWILEQVK